MKRFICILQLILWVIYCDIRYYSIIPFMKRRKVRRRLNRIKHNRYKFSRSEETKALDRSGFFMILYLMILVSPFIWGNFVSPFCMILLIPVWFACVMGMLYCASKNQDKSCDIKWEKEKEKRKDVLI